MLLATPRPIFRASLRGSHDGVDVYPARFSQDLVDDLGASGQRWHLALGTNGKRK